MGRSIHRLTALAVERASKNAKKGKRQISDGGCLWLTITPPAAASWIFRYAAPLPFTDKNGKAKPAGEQRHMGLGSYPTISLAAARDLAAGLRKLRAEGKDPLAERASLRAANALEAAKAITFKTACDEYIAAHKVKWGDRHLEQWENSLRDYAFPILGAIAVAAIDVTLVKQILQPIWYAKTATASRLRGRLECVLDWAKVSGYRTGENPARWKGHLENIFPAESKVKQVDHHAAMPYAALPAFMTELEAEGSLAAEALQLTILTAARSDETIQAPWPEFDLDAALWTIPAGRMKGGKEHTVPLSKAALALLQARYEATGGNGYVFPGNARGGQIARNSMRQLMETMGADFDVHGFRSTFRDWAGEQTAFPGELAERALAHVIKNKTEAAYNRTTLLEKRRLLMEAWAEHCTRGTAVAAVVRIRTAA